MRRLKKKIYYGMCGAALAVLAVIRACNPGVMGETATVRNSPETVKDVPSEKETPTSKKTKAKHEEKVETQAVSFHPIRSVHNYDRAFPDVQDVQIVSAMRWGVSPVLSREQAEERKSELVYIGSNPYYVIDKGMTSSIPYLVPRAADLLQQIGRNYLDSLAVKGVPLHRIIVTSVLRSEEDVKKLRQKNSNVNEQSCHRFGTTFDLAYNRYHTVSPPGEHRRAVTNDTLKYVLSEVLRDLRQQERCYVKYEVKQGCFHITTR